MAPKKCTIACVFCLSTQYKNPSISLHSFPKDQSRRSLWLTACGLTEDDYKPSRKLCSQHFDQDCFKTGTTLNILKPNSVPTKFNKHSKEFFISTSSRKNMPEMSSPEVIYQIDDQAVSTVKFETVSNYEIETVSNCEIETAYNCEMETAYNCEMETVSNYEMETVSNYEIESVSNCEMETAYNCETSQMYDTPKRKRKPRKYYVGDVTTPDLATPRKAKRNFLKAQYKIIEQRNKIKYLNLKVSRLRKRLSSMAELLNHLKKKNFLTEQAHDTMLNTTSNTIKEALDRSLKSKNSKFSPVLRSFALTLQFYSAKAYSYVRKTFNNLLPHPATLRKWYTVVNGNPGFTDEAFKAIELRVKDSTQPIVCNICIDEMAIRKQITYLNGRVYGCVDLGTSVDKNDQDNFEEATSALVFLAVCLNGHWKVPLGYFLIHSLSGSERGNLLKNCLELFNDTGAKCHSITLDGASCNMTMCTSLGANFDYYSPNFKPWIKNPGIPKCSEVDQPIYIFWDAAHMIKLVRNTLGDKKIIVDQENKKIKWSHIVDLLEIQNSKGLHSANKLKKTHVRYHENKMNVRLAAQTLSSSVSSSLKFCEHLNLLKKTNPTAIFCEVFNDAFDITNCRNKLAKGNYYLPISNKTLPHIKQFLDKFKSYVENLRYEGSTSQPEVELLLKSQRKTGFLGLIICITNLINLFEVVKRYEMSYILGYKLSQDHLEVFFSAMRSRGGYNNNPNSVQFKTAYKRLLVRHEIKSSEYGNCSVLDTCSILFVGTAMRKDADAICDVNTDNNENLALFDEVDHDYYKHLPVLEEYVVDIIKYTSGFIVSKIKKKKNLCKICDLHLSQEIDLYTSLLLKIKSKGKLINSSSDVNKICLTAEYILRLNTSILLSDKNIKQKLCVQSLNELSTDSSIFNTQTMMDHILTQDIFDNHRIQLIKLILEYYIDLRMHHYVKLHTQQITGKNIRRNYTKLILFKNQ